LVQETAVLQRLFTKFPTQIKRENILKNREFLSGNREFHLQGVSVHFLRACFLAVRTRSVLADRISGGGRDGVNSGAFGSSASAGRAMAAGPAGPSIRPRPRSGRSARGWPVLHCSLMSWSPNTAITFRITGRARSSPGMASRSTARRSPTGSVVPAGGWSRCRPALQRTCLDQPSCLPTTRQSRCSIPAAAAPRPAASGSTPATIDPGPGRNRRPPSTSTVLIARQSVLPLISGTSVGCCKSTAMLASSG
jgi:hypothetical protein